MVKQIIYFFVLVFAGLFLSADGSKRDIVGAVLEYDAIYGNAVCTTEIDILVERPGEKRLLKLALKTKGKKNFARVLEPEKYRGEAILSIGTDIWRYRPSDHSVRKITVEDMHKPVMETDFTYIDMVRSFADFETFRFEEYTPEKKESGMGYVRYIARKSTTDNIGYMVMAYDKAKRVPCWFRVYSENNRLITTLVYSNVKSVNGRNMPFSLKIIPADKEGYSTTVLYRRIDFKSPIPDNIFSMKNLRKVN